jgi:hypothetical protein
MKRFVITEEEKKHIMGLYEQPDSKMPFQIEKFGYKQGDPSTLGPALEKQSEAIKQLTSISFPQFMEGLREFLTSGTGFVAQLLLEAFVGIGQFINVGAWSVLTVYDINLGVSENKWNWFNIIVDIIGVATTGLGGKVAKNALAPVAKYAGQSIEVFAKSIIKYTPKIFQYVLKIVKSIKSFIGKMSENIKKLMDYFGKKFKNGAIYKGLAKMDIALSASVVPVLTKIQSTFVHVGEHYVKHEAGHGFASTVAGGGH